MENPGLNPTRRDFFTKILPAGTLACLGCTRLCGLFQSAYAQEADQQHKFLADAEMSYADTFGFAFAGYYIPAMKGLQAQIGEDEFIEMLKQASMEAGRQGGENQARSVAANDLATFVTPLTDPDRFWQHALTWEIVENTDTTFGVEISECLWARTFREAEAADIGYAGICHGDFAWASGFNPQMRMERTKTLMQGHDCCNHRWILEA
ncbi:MAG: L-2-amino-thiazoline-4-carboxylic acid hydrolase [Gemmatimonadota bacterium]|nr:MAG: L-2-amino-thiazoline-4-carboxylic acid hydrolase [Gemmatimonadota bacterium]